MSAVTCYGKLRATRGTVLEIEVPFAAVGDLCLIEKGGTTPVLAEIVGFHKEVFFAAPLAHVEGFASGDPVKVLRAEPALSIPKDSGCVLNALGEPFESSSSQQRVKVPLRKEPPQSIERPVIREILETGVSAIDAFVTLGRGQRIGLFAPPGAGKSTLLSMLAQNVVCDVCVIALIGERGREVGEVVEAIGEKGLKRCILVVSTGDEPPARRMMALELATSIAEYHRDQNRSVLLLVDSLTRYSRAVRDIACSLGEIPLRQGLPASLFTNLARSVERAGTNRRGSITAIYTVLTTHHGSEDVLAEEIISLLDGHITLSADLFAQGHRPAIDINCSISRLAIHLQSEEHHRAQNQVRTAIHRLSRDRDALLLGGQPDANLARCIACEPQIHGILNQSRIERRELIKTLNVINKITHFLGNTCSGA